MTEAVTVGVLSLIGTLGGTLGGIIAANKMTNYRIEQLEKKVEKHNSVVERTFILEGQVKELQHEVIDMKKEERGMNHEENLHH